MKEGGSQRPFEWTALSFTRGKGSYEKETRNPTLETIIEFMHVLGVTADYLLGTDNIIKVESNEAQEYRTMTKEEVMFIDELRKDKLVYEILFEDPKRGSELVKKRIG